MENSPVTDLTVVEALKSAVRSLSASRLAAHANDANVRLLEDDSSDLVKAHWMSLILGAGRDMRITFKCHFMSEDGPGFGRGLAEVSSLTEERILDFFKEFCNLTMGGLKILLENNQIQIGTSLPLVTRGFDEVFFPRSSSGSCFEDKWILDNGIARVYCAVHFEIFNPIKFFFNASELEESWGKVEFF